jgi:uncharacterized ion transporter superfamily protein YfcC
MRNTVFDAGIAYVILTTIGISFLLIKEKKIYRNLNFRSLAFSNYKFEKVFKKKHQKTVLKQKIKSKNKVSAIRSPPAA